MFCPFRNESELLCSETGTYMEKLNEPGITDIINQNRTTFEPFAELVDSALSQLRENLMHNQDSFAQPENNKVENMVRISEGLQENIEDEDGSFSGEGNATSIVNISRYFMNDIDLNGICSLNKKQTEVFDVINKWARDYVKNLSAKQSETIEPVHIFLTGKAGSGKFHLIKTIFCDKNFELSYKRS